MKNKSLILKTKERGGGTNRIQTSNLTKQLPVDMLRQREAACSRVCSCCKKPKWQGKKANFTFCGYTQGSSSCGQLLLGNRYEKELCKKPHKRWRTEHILPVKTKGKIHNSRGTWEVGVEGRQEGREREREQTMGMQPEFTYRNSKKSLRKTNLGVFSGRYRGETSKYRKQRGAHKDRVQGKRGGFFPSPCEFLTGEAEWGLVL